MRTHILHHFHTFYPEAQAEHDRLALEEKRLTRALARRGEVDPDEKPRRASEPLPEVDDLDEQLADVRARMAEQKAIIASGVVRLHLQGLPHRPGKSGRATFRRLLAEHPPRDDDELDAQVGYNVDTFGEALIAACILRTENLDGEPVPNEWDKWADDMTDGQWQEVFTAALKLQTDGNPNVFPR